MSLYEIWEQKKKKKHQNNSAKFPLPLFIEIDINLKFSFSTFISNSFTDIFQNTFYLCSGVQEGKGKENQQTACLFYLTI